MDVTVARSVFTRGPAVGVFAEALSSAGQMFSDSKSTHSPVSRATRIATFSLVMSNPEEPPRPPHPLIAGSRHKIAKMDVPNRRMLISFPSKDPVDRFILPSHV